MNRILFLALLLFAGIETASAQETQVPLDGSGTLMVINRSTEDFSEVFPEYRGFQEARLFRATDGGYVLEVLYRPASETMRDRRELTVEEVAELRARVSAAIPTGTVAEGRLDQSGRPRLLRQAAVSSLFLYGPALPVALGVEGSAATTLYLATASAGFFLPYYLTKDAPVSQGAATLSRVGAAHGAVHGLALALLTGGTDISERSAYGLTALASAAEAYLGYRIATDSGVNRGTGETISTVGLFGTITGLSLGGVLSVAPENDPEPDPFEDGEDFFYEDEDFFDKNIRIFSGMALAGSAAGLYAGYRLLQLEPYTRGDARILSTAGALGVNAGILVIDLSNTENGRVGSAMLAAGTVAGMAAARVLTKARDFTSGQGALVALGTSAGALGGFAVAALADAAPTPAYVLGSLGAVVGFGLMYRAYAREAGSAAASRRLGAVDFDLNPLGLMRAMGGSAAGGGGLATPVFRVALAL